MRKAKVVTNYSKVRQDELATQAQSTHDSLTGNADFPTPPVTMVAFLVLITQFIAKLTAAFHGTPIQTAEKNKAKYDLLKGMQKLAVYVNSTADGDEVKLAGSGFTMAKTPKPIGALPAPNVFKVTPSAQPGRVNIEFAGTQNANYLVRLTTDSHIDRNLWPTTVETRRSFMVDGLTSDTRYTFIGAYKGASNELNFSDPVEVVIQ